MKNIRECSYEIIRKHFVIYGNVQGVGFRYRAKYAASGARVTGFVQNEWDGTVVMELQGTESQINQVLRTINSSPYISIEGIDSEQIPVEEGESGFHVRY